jgi:replication initiation and membrane attachment protein DnaB
MGQIKGQTGNPYGRPKGLQNKTTKETKEFIAMFMQKKFKRVEKEFDKLEGVDAVRIYFSLVKYIMPPLAPVKVEEDNEDDIIQKILDNQK